MQKMISKQGQMIETTEKFLTKNKEFLNEEEVTATNNQITVLKLAIASNDKDKVQKETEVLNDISRPFAERVMDVAIKEAMKGKKIM